MEITIDDQKDILEYLNRTNITYARKEGKLYVTFPADIDIKEILGIIRPDSEWPRYK